MKNRKAAPTVILVIFILFVLLQAFGIIVAVTQEGLGFIWKGLIILIPLVFIIAMITVYLERLREINEENKDDLSKY